ncbi:MAG: TRAP transporter small permease [Pseudomonadota bacterium]
MGSTAEAPGRLVAVLRQLITGWALLGGAVLLAVVAMNVGSVVSGALWRPFPGDFELTEVGVAVAVFAFLPYCELTGANVTADIFTQRAQPRTIAILKVAGSLAAFLFAALLVWRMSAGAIDQKTFNYTTTILRVPIWWAYVPILISLGLLVVAAAMTLLAHLRAASQGNAG